MTMTSSQLGRGLGLVLVEFPYEYQGRDGVLVSIKPNERYVLLAKTNDHWWQVCSDHGSKPFYIPAEYVKELPPDFPSPLDFANPPNPEPVLPLPVAAPVPVPVPVPKSLEEPSPGPKTKPGDEVTIRLKPDASTTYRKTENRMSTFGVPLDFHDLSLVVPAPRHPSKPPVGPAETGTTTTSGIPNVTDNALNKNHLPGFLDDHKDSGKHRVVPSFSPADPLSTPRPQTQPIPVETPVVPVVPVVPPHNDSKPSPSADHHDDQESPIEPEEEEEDKEVSIQESTGEEESLKEEDSNHIYESIQDLNLDVETLIGGRVSPGVPPETAPALPPTQVRQLRPPQSPLEFRPTPRSQPDNPSLISSKSSQIVPEYTVELEEPPVAWPPRTMSSKKNVLENNHQPLTVLLIQINNIREQDRSEVSCRLIPGLELFPGNRITLSRRTRTEAASDKEDKDRKRHYNVFGCHLDTLCHRENTTIPKFLEKCIRTVERRGLDVDGIYRVSGNLAVIQKLRHKADHEEQLDLEDGQWEEIHVITGALKLFLRELPEPLFPFSCFDKFIAAIQVPDYSLRVSYMRDLVRSLPLPNHDTMELLFKHLRRVVEHKDSNRMSVQSVAIVFGPTLLRPQTESANMTIHMVFQSQIVELMLNEFQTVFSQR
ncbi:LOW QUALITY PROTEIN: rho GTPase-activating protein 27-like [Morone saxatilis]|uniref:LOW QUALITY PROTEIN: rho GTPase-activating protein 27-like n=1 Tax=Morone saxatilis TaxID=34816 RepID=UPI0015E23C38|nr:LOW QUALITY PROTEIN: rho GTPase-activating protein 27-like [Morone saxatilis]